MPVAPRSPSARRFRPTTDAGPQGRFVLDHDGFTWFVDLPPPPKPAVAESSRAVSWICVARRGGGEDQFVEPGFEALRVRDFFFQHRGAELFFGQRILLLALDADPPAAVLPEDVDSRLRLTRTADFLGVRVAPDLAPEVEAKRLEIGGVLHRRQEFGIGAQGTSPAWANLSSRSSISGKRRP